MNPSSFGEALSQLTQKQVQIAATHVLNGENTNNKVLKRLYSSIKDCCTSIAHSYKAATVARQKYLSLWYFFGAPTICLTFSPCGECIFRVKLYATTEEHNFLHVNNIQDESKVLLDSSFRKKLRSRYWCMCNII